MIIGICGKKGSGKDTLADILVKEFDFVKYNFGDDIKKIAKILFNFDEEQLYGDKKDVLDDNWNIIPRDFYQKFGTEYIQNIFPSMFPDYSLKNKLNKKRILVKKI